MSEKSVQNEKRKELEALVCNELRDLAKELDIHGRWSMTKAQLVDAILGAKNAECSKNMETSAKDEGKVDNRSKSVEAETKAENESADTNEINMEQKMHYVENIEIGTIVAFRLSNGKVKSAKVMKKSTKNRKLMLETDYGAQYVVSYNAIVWVRTGKRWPRGVYKLLKGMVDDERKEQSKS